ncbi:hypothetical protein EDM53_01275 [Rickettsiales endosymbiont of Peranema trichophorum]|uniref:HU family DNA-binding protein n=1 Tax=Rickettsiales endosymbiont of Peranema trichophorum TaxID=2486577 RepID=UPI0010234CA8|nr:HU family DNA-binding protein [Rickettsiales endosymbiont of Peranema trichophorum]RZI47561.1 hypothetical protein EDM53_01275 [Rickettsiales endosymbiont of Peranema trichophorum]
MEKVRPRPDTIKKIDIVNNLHRLNPDIPLAKLVSAVSTFFEQIATALTSGDRIQIRGFGSITTRSHNSRTVNNLRGMSYIIPARYAVHFKASEKLIEYLNTPKKQENE